MAHNINIENGKAAFFSLRESPWHKLGQVVNQPVSSREAIKLAGLNWDVKTQGLYREDMTTMDNHRAIVRMDTGANLGIVGTGYTPVQNSELFAFMQGLDGFSDVILETAGALGAGETVWVLAKVTGLRFGIRGDEHQGYMAIINGHAGNSKLVVMPTTVRIVCQNTMRMAMGSHQRKNNLSTGFTIRHTAGILNAMTSIREAYTKTTLAWETTKDLLNTLAAQPITEKALERLFHEPWKQATKAGSRSVDAESIAALLDAPDGDDGDEGTRSVTIAHNREERLRGILASETCQQPGTRDTLFSAYNAVTEFIEHESSTRVRGDMTQAAREALTNEKRFESANFGGNGDRMKAQALKIALELATA